MLPSAILVRVMPGGGKGTVKLKWAEEKGDVPQVIKSSAATATKL